ncbi:MAG: sigma 54-interacting transcriptional regulator [Planctomycetota bacterium]
MPFFSPSDRRFAVALSELAYCNPFEPERLVLERKALGPDYLAEESVAWSRTEATAHTERANVARLAERAEAVAERCRRALLAGALPTEAEMGHYEDVVSYVLYYRTLANVTPAGLAGHKSAVAAQWKKFLEGYRHFFDACPAAPLACQTPEHLFACLFQLRRAFRQIFDCILGDSLPAARLRGKVWQSIFTHDMRRYRRSLFGRMADFSTLITGPSGTGKELVARAIALSQYVAFDPASQSFAEKADDGFRPINLSALSATLLESELFGHCRGSYTGAVADRVGWLESCPPHGAVFLDEIGELDETVQVKLLRVVQERVFCRLGETSERSFAGKLIAATNRDLTAEMAAGRFRQDLYYRLCSDRIDTPTLREQVADRPEALPGIVRLIAQRVAGEDADSLADEVDTWIAKSMDADYAWPGNIRELEQCVRNVLVRREYTPRAASAIGGRALPPWLDGVPEGRLTADELVCRYCTVVYAKLGSYEGAAKALGLDRRTVRSKVDAELLASLTGGKEFG